jgi:hypothetical protein
MQIRTWAEAVLVAGTLDILSAFVFAGMKGTGPIAVLGGVATGPFGDAMANSGWTGAAAGLGVHFGIMAVQVATFMLLAAWQPGILQTRVVTGVLYGLAVYVVMYWVVLPIRWPDVFPAGALRHIPTALFSHICCVGLPIVLIVAHGAAARGAGWVAGGAAVQG